MGRRGFSQRCGPESVVHSPQSAVRSPQSALHTPHSLCSWRTADRIGQISSFARCGRNVLESKNIVFPRQEHRFFSSSKYGTGMDSERTQDILFGSEQKYFSRFKHADTVALIGVGTERYSTVLCSSK